MCRNIRTLYNFTPPATDEEIRAASLQFIRKITGFKQPSKMNEEGFENAVAQVALISKKLAGVSGHHGLTERSGGRSA